MDDFYAARRGFIPPLPWPTFSPPFSGYLLERLRYPLAPLILGIVLGPILEENFRKLLGADGTAAALFTDPIALTFMALAVAFLAFGLYRQRAASGETEAQQAGESTTAPGQPH